MKNAASLARLVIVFSIFIGLLFTGISVYAVNVNKAHHPNLAAAQTLIEKAIAKVSEAQRANEYDMNGHAAKAKSLLDQAYDEIKLAAQAANVNK
jgi:hypothetical protein